jgi:translin
MDFEETLSSIREEIESDDAVREKSLPLARDAVRKCSQSIKESHRGDFNTAKRRLDDAYSLIVEAGTELASSEYLSKSRILDTAYQEFVEAAYVLTILERGSLAILDEYDIPSRQYLTGLADTIGELRRATLDALRNDDLDKAEGFLHFMEKIQDELQNFDFPNALIPDLRRKCDVARSIIERTRGDLTTAVRQSKLIHEIRNFEHRMEKE